MGLDEVRSHLVWHFVSSALLRLQSCTSGDTVQGPNNLEAFMNSIAAALAKAQQAMGKALKQSNNPHFRSKYADLGNVMDACLPALNAQGIAVVQPVVMTEHGNAVRTTLIHESGESLSCDVPLLLGKNDMQGLGSAITYARRYGLMSMAGIAPEDDDGNAAVQSSPAKMISADQYQAIAGLLEKTGSDEGKLLTYFGVKDLHDMDAGQADKCIAMLKKKVA